MTMQTTIENPSGESRQKVRQSMLPKWLTVPLYRTNMTIWLLFADLISLICCFLLAIWFRSLIKTGFQSDNYFILMPLIILFIAGYALSGLYPGIGINPVEEFQKLTISSSIVMVSLTAITFLTQSGLRYSRLMFLFLWILILCIMPVNRKLMRKLGLLFHIWGEPVAMLGYGQQGKKILKYLLANPSFGIRPVIIIDGTDINTPLDGSTTGKLDRISANVLLEYPRLLSDLNIQTVILAPTEIPEALSIAMIDEQKFGIKHLILISSLNWIGGSAVTVHDMSGFLGLEVEHNLLKKRQSFFKRLFDFFLLIICGVVGFPIMAVCALLIHFDSPGPIFYKHKRVGKGGKDLYVWKFRTMIEDADEVLELFFEKNPSLRKEWERTRKLKNDPRVTKVGRILRKFSLDELPQLINIMRGEMSFIGPRPIVKDEIKYFDKTYSLYTQVLPGLSGLWQISGRSDTSYDSRVSLDEYYIRHWSIWMDIYILANTFGAVIRGSGAY